MKTFADNECWGIKIEIAKELSSNGAFLAQSCIKVKNRDKDKEYLRLWENLVKQLAKEISEKHTIEKLKNNRVARAYRNFFWRHEIDPTKTRPAGEALARRILRKKQIPSINPIVDAGNLASALTLISIGLYDVKKIPSKNLVLKYSEGGEKFNPIGGKTVILEKGIPVLKSSDTIMHIYPHRDSKETMIDAETEEVLALAAGVNGIEHDECLRALEYTITFMNRLGLNPIVLMPPKIIL